MPALRPREALGVLEARRDAMVIAPDDTTSGVSISVAKTRAGNVSSRKTANNRKAAAATTGMPSHMA